MLLQCNEHENKYKIFNFFVLKEIEKKRRFFFKFYVSTYYKRNKHETTLNVRYLKLDIIYYLNASNAFHNIMRNISLQIIIDFLNDGEYIFI